MRPFRILLIDDSLFNLQQGRSTPEFCEYLYERRNNITSPIAGLLGELIDISKKRRNLEIYFAGSVNFQPKKRAGKVQNLVGPEIVPESPNEVRRFLSSIDILLLDLKGVGTPPSYLRLEQSDLPELKSEIPEEDLEELNNEFGGGGFYLKGRLNELKNCQAVIVISQYDRAGVPDVIRNYLHPFCSGDDQNRPYTIKVSLENSDMTRTLDRIKGMIESFYDGFVDLHSKGAIEFAASHDLPVTIVGESGTGKEYIARQIHKRWCQENSRNEINGNTNYNFITVNCAGLDKGTARSELFGHVKGSFTDGHKHKLGVFLKAVGLTFNGKDHSKHSFEDLLDSGLISVADDHVLIKNADARPKGTVFLDEFAELPLDVATMLLRFLEDFEVRPLGMTRPIKGANVRIIVATSDPTIANFCGVKDLIGTWRSSTELNQTIRQDLIFRVLGQVIRAEPIRQKTAKSRITSLVKSLSEKDRVIWSQKAIDKLVEYVEGLLEKIENFKVSSDDFAVPVFGHYRQVSMFIKLVNAYQLTAQKRGVRSTKDNVGSDVIDKLWKNTEVSRLDMSSAQVGIEEIEEELNLTGKRKEIFAALKAKDLSKREIIETLRKNGREMEEKNLPGAISQLNKILKPLKYAIVFKRSQKKHGITAVN